MKIQLGKVRMEVSVSWIIALGFALALANGYLPLHEIVTFYLLPH